MNIDQIEGLTSREVLRKQKKFGYNELPSRNKRNIFKMLVGLLTEPMIILLLSTVIIYFFLGDKNEAILLMMSFLCIVGIEFYQDAKTEKSLEALKNLSSPICDVIRNGKKVTIPGRELVVGDIIFLYEGSRVPADAKLISAESLRVNESLLTGESEPVDKRVVDIKDYRTNSVFSGSLVVKGHGVAEVTNTGAFTEVGKIGTSLKSIEAEKTLLQKDVNNAIRLVATMAVALSIFLTIVYWLSRNDFIQGLLAGLTLAIAILPEEFPIVLTIFMALGAWRLAKNNVITRKSQVIETLGSTTVLCVDKTGTLTENRMRILSVIDKNGKLYDDDFHAVNKIIKYGILASQKDPFDPMEEAFLEAGRQIFNDLGEIYKKRNIVKEYSVETESLSVAHIWTDENDNMKIALKGAPESVLELCHMSREKQLIIGEEVKKLASRGLRVIAVAKGDSNKITSIPDDRRDIDYEFLGLVGLADPIRKEAMIAAKACRQAGIRIVMITGDHSETALNIAKQVGLNCDDVITGNDFEDMPESEKRRAIKTACVFSRVSPSHKLMIVKAFKAAGEVVAMTGDGVNDAPALKAAHVGIAMGKRGTDVARESAGIVLADDNFVSIVNGVRLGRRIYDNLQKAMSYIISVHIPIAFLSIIPVILKWPLVLIPAHIVFLEFIIDPSCTVIFENEKESKDIMDRPPRKLTDSIFNKKMVIGSLLKGMIIAIVVVVMFKIMMDLGWGEDKARGITFLTLVVSNIFLILGISGRQAINDIFRRENTPMLVMLIVTLVSLALIFNVPFLMELFHFAPISVPEAMLGLSVGVMSVLGVMPIKYLLSKKHN